MSKKKLEEIAYNVGISIDGDKALMSSDDYDFLYRYALEQAERVQELEKENSRIRQMKYHEAYEQGKFDTNMKVWYEYPKLEQQNKRYREALELIKLKTLDIKGNKDTRPFQIYGIAWKALEGNK